MSEETVIHEFRPEFRGNFEGAGTSCTSGWTYEATTAILCLCLEHAGAAAIRLQLRWHGHGRMERASESHLANMGQNTLFALVTWQVWKERNARLFRRDSQGQHQLLLKIKDEADLWIAVGAKNLGCLFGK